MPGFTSCVIYGYSYTQPSSHNYNDLYTCLPYRQEIENYPRYLDANPTKVSIYGNIKIHKLVRSPPVDKGPSFMYISFPRMRWFSLYTYLGITAGQRVRDFATAGCQISTSLWSCLVSPLRHAIHP